jgi:hypothetical protein
MRLDLKSDFSHTGTASVRRRRLFCRVIRRVSRGRLTDAHDEVRYVIRKPEDRFARVV